MLVRLLVVAAWAVLSSAAPAPARAAAPAPAKQAIDTVKWSPQMAAFYSAVSKEITKLKASPAFKNGQFSCNPSQGVMPPIPTPLPAPNAGATLKHVMLGVGTQNYSCPGTNTPDAPKSVGAFAQLFNVTCTAANYPELLEPLPALAYQHGLPSIYFPPAGTRGEPPLQSIVDDFKFPDLDMIYSGLHTFRDETTPLFNLDVPNSNGGIFAANGRFLGKKNSSTPAWPNSTQGAFGVVPYLKLDAVEGTTHQFTNMYRLHTQGGSAPQNCSGNTGYFTVPYTATYWVYGL